MKDSPARRQILLTPSEFTSACYRSPEGAKRDCRSAIPFEAASNRKYKIAVVEDEPLYLELLKIALSHNPGIEIVGAYCRGEELLSSVPEIEPDVVLLDIELGDGINGIEVAMRLREKSPQIGIVLLSNHRDPSFALSLREGELVGWAYLLKKSVSNVDALRRAIAGVADGQIVLDEALLEDADPRPATPLAKLTPRQREIVELIAQGYSNAGIASRLVVSIKTVENHINGLYQELNIERNGAYHPRVLAVLAYLDQLNLHQPQN